MAAQNVRDMPLRAVVGIVTDERGFGLEQLVCGHLDRTRTTGLGYATTVKRRRCWQCLRCSECGKPVYAGDAITRHVDGFRHVACPE